MKQMLLNMLADVHSHNTTPNKYTLMLRYVEERLDKSFNQYNTELQQSLSLLTSKHEKSLLKRMKKLDERT